MSETCPTVMVDSENGPFIMNESDFDAKVHKLYVEPEVTKKLTKKEAIAKLKELEIEHDPKAKVDDLIALIPAE